MEQRHNKCDEDLFRGAGGGKRAVHLYQIKFQYCAGYQESFVPSLQVSLRVWADPGSSSKDHVGGGRQ